MIPATGGALNNNSTLGPLGSNAGLGPDTDTDHADPVPPRVDGAPNTIWLNYGDIDHDCTHAERYRDGDVTWCDERMSASDVAYVRAEYATAEMAVANAALEAANTEIAQLKRLLRTPSGY